LTVKLIPQFAEMATPKIEDNLFYSAIKLMLFPGKYQKI
jgi:hypothetical protein